MNAPGLANLGLMPGSLRRRASGQGLLVDLKDCKMEVVRVKGLDCLLLFPHHFGG